MVQPLAVAFDCDGVLADNGSSWQAIHDAFETENKQMLAKFIAREIDDDELMAEFRGIFRNYVENPVMTEKPTVEDIVWVYNQLLSEEE